MYIRDIVVVLNVAEYNKSSIGQLILTGKTVHCLCLNHRKARQLLRAVSMNQNTGFTGLAIGLL